MTTTKKKPKNYLNNVDIMKEWNQSMTDGKMTNTFADMMKQLTKRYAVTHRFAGYTYNEDMQAFALMTICKVWKSFNPKITNNPFAYFTQIIHNAFFAFNNQERKERMIRDKLLVNQGKPPSFGFSESASYDGDSYGDTDFMEFLDNSANEFEYNDDDEDYINEVTPVDNT